MQNQYLCTEKKEFVLNKQLLRSGTSIGANIEEGIGGQSKKNPPLDILLRFLSKKFEHTLNNPSKRIIKYDKLREIAIISQYLTIFVFY